MTGNQVFHCAAVLLGLRPAATQLSAPETALLEELAELSPVIAEIGVFEGLTSRRMISRMPANGTMYCIDPFFSGRLGVAYGYWITRAQTRRASRPDVDVRIVRKLSYQFAAEHAGEFDLIFIDADHSYEAVKRDWQDWTPKLKIGGRIALHDSQPMPGRCPETCGPVRLVRELGATPPGLEQRQGRDTLSVYQRVA
jgi:predicted O-methyltransferase YrrM